MTTAAGADRQGRAARGAVRHRRARLRRTSARHRAGRGGLPGARVRHRASGWWTGSTPATRTSRTSRRRSSQAVRRSRPVRGHHRRCAAGASPTRSRSACRRRSRSSRIPTSATSWPPPSRSSGRCAAGQAVILESTTYPGTTREIMLPALESTGLKVGRGLLPRVQPGAGGSRQPGLRHPEHAEGGRRHHARLPPGGAARSTSPPSTRWCRCPRPRRPSWSSCSRTPSAA